MDSEEQILVIPTSVFHEAGIFQGIHRDVGYYSPRLLDPRHFSFLPRSAAEKDPSYKQLIPYIVLKYRDQVFHYRRGQGSGEKRLRALRSVGVGGHINLTDNTTTEHPYRQGLLRELAEEVQIDTAYREKCVGFLNDDSVPVGTVHLGVVHVFELDAPRVQRREADILHSGFAPIEDLWREKEAFETWSQFVLADLMQGAYEDERELPRSSS